MILFSILLQSENIEDYVRTIFDPATECDIRRSWVTTWFLIGRFRNSKTKMVFEILMAWENEFVKIFTLFPEIHAPVLSNFIALKHYS